jgi:threonine aldolase
MATLLAAELSKIEQVRITQPVDANGVFVTIPPGVIPALQEEQFFYVWTGKISEARLMCSFDTTEEDVMRFADRLRRLLHS